jgi:hypothetical protein
MLSEWLVPQLQQAGIKDTAVLQFDGAPPHFDLHVHDYLNETFPGRWIEPQCSLGIHQGQSQQTVVLHNRSITGSCIRSLHSRDHGLSVQNICQNVVQNSTVL